ncbi:uncharacterized protein LOC130714408 [Lotus japonicus]|uniref:uncharacterized protein LOC130714408 n=1 Tax=Lotus japonicus TaxID=34305 RepID=UPI00258499A5|nr:uncharacterized protein LOC130714408 [Lotus japonicus]
MDPNNMVEWDIYDVVIDELINDTTIEDMMQEEMEFYQQHANTVRPKRTRKVIERYREAGHERLWMDYFSENPVYPEELFRRRFRMRKDVFLRVVDAVGSHNPYFLQSVDAVGRQSLTPLQKCTAAIRMLAYGSPADSVDEYVRIGESTAIECLNFVEGSNNDINVLNQSPVFNDVLSGNAPMVNFSVNGTMYHMGYYLADGIYPLWSTFVKTISMPQGEKRQKFAKRQEAARKDVERAFDILQSRFAIVRGPSRFWHPNDMKSIIFERDRVS